MSNSNTDRAYLSTFLGDLEQEALVRFNADPIMAQAVKKVLLSGLNRHGVMQPGKEPDMLRNAALARVANHGDEMDDQALGADIRAYWRGLNAVESAFSVIESFQPAPEGGGKKGNPAR